MVNAPPGEKSSPAGWQRRWFLVGLWALAGAAVTGAVPALLMAAHIVPLDYNEGWNAMWSEVAMQGGRLYPAPDSAVANNYPPLSFFLVGVVGLAFDDNVIAGRVVALASLSGVIAALFYWLRMTGSSRRISAAGAALLAAAFVGFAPGYIAMNDPQLLAHAIAMAAIICLWRGDLSTRALAATAVLVVIAGFTKQLLLPVPIAITIWLAIHHRARVGAWIGAIALAMLLACILVWAAYGNDFFRDILAGRVYSLHAAKVASIEAARRLSPLLVLSAIAMIRLRQRPAGDRSHERVSFVLLYVAAAALIDGASAGGAGVDVNAFFDVLIASSMGAALGLEALESTEGLPQGVAPIAALAALWISAAQLTADVLWRLPAELERVAQLRAREEATRSVIRILAEADGEAACEDLALCYWAHKSFVVDLYNLGQKLETGVVGTSVCETLFAGPRVRILQMDEGLRRGRARITGSCLAVIQKNFEVIPSPSTDWILYRHELPARLDHPGAP